MGSTFGRIWIPGGFTEKPSSRTESLWTGFSPLGWETLPFFALMVPVPLCEYAAFRGHRVLGVVGLLAWTPILWLLLVAFHRAGRVRIWLSAPIAMLVYVAAGLLLAAGFP